MAIFIVNHIQGFIMEWKICGLPFGIKSKASSESKYDKTYLKYQTTEKLNHYTSENLPIANELIIKTFCNLIEWIS
jgi:hypothetical protein